MCYVEDLVHKKQPMPHPLSLCGLSHKKCQITLSKCNHCSQAAKDVKPGCEDAWGNNAESACTNSGADMGSRQPTHASPKSGDLKSKQAKLLIEAVKPVPPALKTRTAKPNRLKDLTKTDEPSMARPQVGNMLPKEPKVASVSKAAPAVSSPETSAPAGSLKTPHVEKARSGHV